MFSPIIFHSLTSHAALFFNRGHGRAYRYVLAPAGQTGASWAPPGRPGPFANTCAMGKQQVLSSFFAAKPPKTAGGGAVGGAPAAAAGAASATPPVGPRGAQAAKRKAPAPKPAQRKRPRAEYIDSDSDFEHDDGPAAAAPASGAARAGGGAEGEPGSAAAASPAARLPTPRGPGCFDHVQPDPARQAEFGEALESMHAERVRREQPAPTSSSKSGDYTPLEKQVMALKQKHKGILLAVEVGYKFMFYGEDAKIAAEVLSIVAYPKNRESHAVSTAP